MRTEMKNAMRGDNSELSNDQLESVAGGLGLTPAQISGGLQAATPTVKVAWYNYFQQQQAAQGVPPSQQPPA